ncbi:hypothetical protein Bbelb_332720 [Branchiostoma belcheri]|nr:hypothetical protein Bbelb_332720 [Branchiostoma belcheri]
MAAYKSVKMLDAASPTEDPEDLMDPEEMVDFLPAENGRKAWWRLLSYIARVPGIAATAGADFYDLFTPQKKSGGDQEVGFNNTGSREFRCDRSLKFETMPDLRCAVVSRRNGRTLHVSPGVFKLK